eukprot:5253895-Pyramimonas_sp.AAC.1
MEDARAISRQLAACGHRVNAAGQAAYLGVDLSGGRWHGRATRTARSVKHAKMPAKIGRYARTLRKYRVTSRLEQQGAAPAGLYGHRAHGVYGSQLAA